MTNEEDDEPRLLDYDNEREEELNAFVEALVDSWLRQQCKLSCRCHTDPFPADPCVRCREVSCMEREDSFDEDDIVYSSESDDDDGE